MPLLNILRSRSMKTILKRLCVMVLAVTMVLSLFTVNPTTASASTKGLRNYVMENGKHNGNNYTIKYEAGGMKYSLIYNKSTKKFKIKLDVKQDSISETIQISNISGSKTKKCNFKFVINMSESTTMNITGKINPAKFTGKGSKGISSLKASVNGTDSSGEYLESLKSQLVYLVNCCLTMNDYMLLGKYSSKDLGFDKYEPIVEGAN